MTKISLAVLAKRRHESDLVLAEAVRAACTNAAVLAYYNAGIRGLCHDGRWECALAAIRHLDLRRPSGPVDG